MLAALVRLCYNAVAPTLADGKDIAAQCDVNGNLKVVAVGLTAGTLGQAAMAASVPVVIASDQNVVATEATLAKLIPATTSAVITPGTSSFAALRELYVGGGGTIVGQLSGDSTTVTFANVPQGSRLPYAFTKILAVGTDASSLIGLR